MDLLWMSTLVLFIIVILGLYVRFGKMIANDCKTFKSDPENIFVDSAVMILLTWILLYLIGDFPCKIETTKTTDASVTSLGTQFFIDYKGNSKKAATVTYVPKEKNEKYEVEITKFHSLTGKIVYTKYDLYIPVEEKSVQ